MFINIFVIECLLCNIIEDIIDFYRFLVGDCLIVIFIKRFLVFIFVFLFGSSFEGY